MLENTAVAQALVNAMRGDAHAKVAISFPDPLYSEAHFNSLIVAPSINAPDLMSFTVDRLDDGATLVGRQTAIDVEQAERLIAVLMAWVAERQTSRVRGEL